MSLDFLSCQNFSLFTVTSVSGLREIVAFSLQHNESMF